MSLGGTKGPACLGTHRLVEQKSSSLTEKSASEVRDLLPCSATPFVMALFEVPFEAIELGSGHWRDTL